MWGEYGKLLRSNIQKSSKFLTFFMIFCKKFQVHPLRHKEVTPVIPFERQSLLVQEQLAALGGELDSLSTMGGGDHA